MATNGQKGSVLNWVDPKDDTGEFKRKPSVFRNHISSEPGAKFPPEKDRYHLYVSYACPWAHRALIVRQFKGLQEMIPYTSVHWFLGEKGWRFATTDDDDDDAPGDNVTPDPLQHGTHLRHIYFETNPDYEGRFTVPTLYDKKQKTIVSNESSEIIRMFYYEFDGLLPDPKTRSLDLFPQDLRSKIDETNEWTYNDINNGVYKSGFATTQEAYEKAVITLFKSLDRSEADLKKSGGPYYFGDRLTEADVRLFTTIVRFDVVYVQHFKCNIRDIRSGYPALHKWLRHLYWKVPAFRDTTNFIHIKKHYTKSHLQINPKGITPLGPEPNILSESQEVPAVQEGAKL